MPLLDTYRGGYKKALLDMRNLLENESFTYQARSKKQFQNLVSSFLDLVLREPEVFESMLETGVPEMMITKGCECRPAREFHKRR